MGRFTVTSRLPPEIVNIIKFAASSIQIICTANKISQKVDEEVIVKRKEPRKTTIVAGVSRWWENRCQTNLQSKWAVESAQIYISQVHQTRMLLTHMLRQIGEK